MPCANCNIARSRGFIFCPFCGERVENTNYQNVQNENQIPQQQIVNQSYMSQQPSQNNQQYGQPYYQQPYQQNYNQQYPQPQYYQQSNLNEPSKPKGRKVIVTALLGFIFSLLGIFFSIPALVLGIIGFKKTKTSDDRVYNVTLNKAFSVIAITLSSICLGMVILIKVLQIATMFTMI